MARGDEDRTTVRRPAVEDAEGLADLHVRAWQVAYRGMIPDSYLDSLPIEIESRTERWRMRIAQPDPTELVTLVAEIDGSLVGWVTAGENRDDDVTDENTGEIWGIYVDPEHWRRRVGSVLMERAIEELATAGYTEATLWVLEENRRARRFYERWGWRPDGGTDWFERDGWRAIEIRYRLPLGDTLP